MIGEPRPVVSSERAIAGLPRGVWALGFTSLFMDLSSELIHALLPVFLVVTLGTSAALLGLIEGVAEATTAFAKLFSGALSDRLGRRKPLALLGYGMAALTKPLFPLAEGAGTVFLARFLDRLGKGIRGAPRDALVADIAPLELRASAYGLRQSLDTVGAFLGPLAAIALMWLFSDDIRTVLWFAVLPAIVCVLVLWLGVDEPRTSPPPMARAAATSLRLADLAGLGSAFFGIVAVAVLLSLARFSEAFLVLRAQDTGMAIGLVPLVMVVMSSVYSAVAWPAGRLGDRMDRRRLLFLGILVLVPADLILALARSPLVVLLGVAVWGLHMGLTQGLLAALVADAVPAQRRGTAFGLFHLATGVATLLGSALAGGLWDLFGAPAAFLVGGGLALASALLLLASPRGSG
ncbi:MAG: MFS transporter [Geminicoccaceae bacterium]|nr:MFS transporter [Geminicoccaceae bacterium]MCX7628655.1 MFS transporter [Geminicoccaceae bacterium]